MTSKRSVEVLDEMVQLSADIIIFCKKLSLLPSVVDQVTRSVTSIGANFSEAQDASSRKDFVNKIYIAKKEASETKYWLSVIAKLTGDKQSLEALTNTTQRFVMMLQKIINTTKEPNRKSLMANASQMDNR